MDEHAPLMHMVEERRREKERWQRIQAMVELYMYELHSAYSRAAMRSYATVVLLPKPPVADMISGVKSVIPEF